MAHHGDLLIEQLGAYEGSRRMALVSRPIHRLTWHSLSTQDTGSQTSSTLVDPPPQSWGEVTLPARRIKKRLKRKLGSWSRSGVQLPELRHLVLHSNSVSRSLPSYACMRGEDREIGIKDDSSVRGHPDIVRCKKPSQLMVFLRCAGSSLLR